VDHEILSVFNFSYFRKIKYNIQWLIITSWYYSAR